MDITLTVDGMTCSHCVQAVENAVKGLDGVSDVTISLDEKKVTVQFDEKKATVEQISEAIEDQGYDVAS